MLNLEQAIKAWHNLWYYPLLRHDGLWRTRAGHFNTGIFPAYWFICLLHYGYDGFNPDHLSHDHSLFRGNTTSPIFSIELPVDQTESITSTQNLRGWRSLGFQISSSKWLNPFDFLVREISEMDFKSNFWIKRDGVWQGIGAFRFFTDLHLSTGSH